MNATDILYAKKLAGGGGGGGSSDFSTAHIKIIPLNYTGTITFEGFTSEIPFPTDDYDMVYSNSFTSFESDILMYHNIARIVGDSISISDEEDKAYAFDGTSAIITGNIRYDGETDCFYVSGDGTISGDFIEIV